MKKIAALLILLITVVAVSVVPSFSSGATVNSGAVIYDKTSTGAMVVRIQMRLRELGYLNFKPTGSYKSMTVSAVKAFQTIYHDNGYEMQVDGRITKETLDLLFRFDALRVSLGGISIPSGPKHGSNELQKTGSIVSWDTVKQMLVTGRSYNIVDCYTGKEFALIFTGGNNHAEMEPASELELEDFMAICGKEFNYLKRPVVISVNGQDIAASIQCWPHGAASITENGVDGHVCLFFDGSSSDVGNLPDVEHIENVYKAGGQ